MASTAAVALGVLALGVVGAACGSSGPLRPDLPKGPSTGDAFEGGVKCNAVRPPTEPDLMGWDPGSRANLSMLRSQGVVAVRYRAEGCNVELEVLSNCIGSTGKYSYSAYAATDTKIAHNAQELYAELPIGAARLGGKLRGGRALRTDYTLVGMQALPVGSSYQASDLRGPDCERATHVVSRMYLGGFAMVAGETAAIEAAVSVFGVGLGGSQVKSAEHVAREGVAEACEKAQLDGKESAQCAAPLRVGLLAIAGRAEGGCPTGSTFDGKACVQKQVVTQIECPPGTELVASRCVASVSTECAGGMHFEPGRGCVPDVTTQPAIVAPSTPAALAKGSRPPPPTPFSGSSRPVAGVGPGLDSPSVQRVVSSHQNGVKRTCWERGGADSKGSVNVMITAQVGPAGNVVGTSSSGDDPVVAKCIEQQVKGWMFPAPGSTTTVDIPFKFVRQ